MNLLFRKERRTLSTSVLKKYKTLEESTARQKPLFDYLSEKYGISSDDPESLLTALKTDEQEKKLPDRIKQEIERKRLISARAETLSRRWASEGEELKKHIPGFDFKSELQNPAFTSLLKSGMSVRRAYTAVHSDEILKNAVSGTAKTVAEQTLKSIRTQGTRPTENGLHHGSGIIRKTDVSSLTGKDIRSILKQVENGTKIRF